MESSYNEVDLSIQRLFYWGAYADKYGGTVQVSGIYIRAFVYVVNYSVYRCHVYKVLTCTNINHIQIVNKADERET